MGYEGGIQQMNDGKKDGSEQKPNDESDHCVHCLGHFRVQMQR